MNKSSALLDFSSSSSSQVRVDFRGVLFFSSDKYIEDLLVDGSSGEKRLSNVDRSSWFSIRRLIGAIFMSSFTWNDINFCGTWSISIFSACSVTSHLLSTFFGTKNFANASIVFLFLFCSASILCRFSSSRFLRSSSFSRSANNHIRNKALSRQFYCTFSQVVYEGNWVISESSNQYVYF